MIDDPQEAVASETPHFTGQRLGVRMVPLDRLRPHPLNSNVMPDDLREKLRAHIHRTGRYPHVIVRPHPDEPGTYQVLDGHHRVEILRELGHKEARCDVWDVDDREAKLLLATLNRLQGQDLPIRRAQLIHELLGEMSAVDLAGGQVAFDGAIFDGEHDAIVDQETWDAVQAALDTGSVKPQRRSTKTPSLLAGILRCGPCDAAMTPTYSQAHGRRYRYYLCLRAHRQGWSACPSKSVPAVEIEKFVVDKIRAIGCDPELVAATTEQAGQTLAAKRSELEAEIRASQKDIDATHATARAQIAPASRRRRDAGTGADVVALEERIAGLQAELASLKVLRIAAADLQCALAAFDPLWEHLTSGERARIVHLLIERIDYDGGTSKLAITFSPAGVRTLATDGVVPQEATS